MTQDEVPADDALRRKLNIVTICSLAFGILAGPMAIIIAAMIYNYFR